MCPRTKRTARLHVLRSERRRLLRDAVISFGQERLAMFTSGDSTSERAGRGNAVFYPVSTDGS